MSKRASHFRSAFSSSSLRIVSLLGFKPPSAVSSRLTGVQISVWTDFSSPACHQEVQFTLAKKKSIVLVHETDPKKGGALLATLQAESVSKNCSAVFDEGGEIIPWHRSADFQLLSLKMIAVRMLHCMPEFKLLAQPPEAYIPGEIGLHKFEFVTHTKVYVCESNPGAKEMMETFKAKYARDGNLEITLCAPPQLRQNIKRKGYILSKQQMFKLGSGKPRMKQLSCLIPRRNHLKNLGELTPRSRSRYLADDVDVTHMLLYASSMTFAAEEGSADNHERKSRRDSSLAMKAPFSSEGMTPEAPKPATQVEDTTRDRLAREVKRALARGIEVLLVHENHEQSGGCPFGDVIARTPHELVAAGLYKKIAVAWHAGQHRTVSLALVARALGAKQMRSRLTKVRDQMTSTAQRMCRSTSMIDIQDDRYPRPRAKSGFQGKTPGRHNELPE